MIPTLYKSALHPREVKALFKLKLSGNKFAPSKESLKVLAERMDDADFCCEALNKVSRSFAVVIQQLPGDLKQAALDIDPGFISFISQPRMVALSRVSE